MVRTTYLICWSPLRGISELFALRCKNYVSREKGQNVRRKEKDKAGVLLETHFLF